MKSALDFLLQLCFFLSKEKYFKQVSCKVPDKVNFGENLNFLFKHLRSLYLISETVSINNF